MADIQKELDDRAKAVLAEYGIPNIAAVIVRDDGATVLSTAQGIRDTTKSATAASNKVKTTDYFNVGSVSKPITGFLIACLIKKDVLDWNTRIADVFTEFKSKAFRARCGMNENFLNTKVFELLSHTSGISGSYYHTANAPKGQSDTDPFRFPWDQGIYVGGNSRDEEWKNLDAVVYQRYLYAVLCMKKKRFEFGAAQNFKYENTGAHGYGSMVTICVSMVERLTGKPFETIMTELLADTLDLEIKYGKLPDGMQYHPYDDPEGKFLPDPNLNNDFAPFNSKNVTGALHCTVTGMAQFIKYNLRALDHSSVFDIDQYHKPVTNAARGGLFLGNGADGELNHNGATAGSRADMRVYPHGGRGFGVMLNSGGGPEPDDNKPQESDLAQREMLRELRDMHANWDAILAA